MYAYNVVVPLLGYTEWGDLIEIIVLLYKYYLYKQAKHCVHKSFFPNECKMLPSVHHHLNLITHVNLMLG